LLLGLRHSVARSQLVNNSVCASLIVGNGSRIGA